MSAAAPASVPFDARPLVEPVDRAAVGAYARATRGAGPRTQPATIVAVIIIAIVFATVIPVLLSVFLGVVGAFVSLSDPAGGGGLTIASALVTFVPWILMAVVFAAAAVFFVRGMLGGQERRYRLDRFARANGMSYAPVLDNPPLPGMIFSIGGSRQARDLVRGERPRFVEFANYRYTTGSGRDRTTHVWGYVAVKLDVPLPNIVLDAKSNNGLFGSNLPTSFAPDQRLSLEGDFDEHFALYCPEGYEADALYLFTPDIMARFIDHAAALDVEIVDDWLFLYGKRDFSTLDPATWGWLFSVVAALLDKLAQWGRWRDERLAHGVGPTGAGTTDAAATVSASAPAGGAPATALPFAAPGAALRPPPGVAREGRRLQRRTPWVLAGVFVAIVFGWQLVTWIIGLIASN